LSHGDSQIVVPRSFIELFMVEGRTRPSEPQDVIAARYELCEDMAQMLVETARVKLFDLGVAETDVLERVRRGLLGKESPLQPDESTWVVRRLAELLTWPCR
jgi:hypothetical protein